jgi:hypothetical protein
LDAPLGELQSFELRGQILARDRETCLLAAQRDVGDGDFRRDRHLHVAEVGRGAPHVGIRRAHAATVGAEDVRLPARVDARVVLLRGAECIRATTLARQAEAELRE